MTGARPSRGGSRRVSILTVLLGLCVAAPAQPAGKHAVVKEASMPDGRHAFRATGADDLALPVQQAFARAVQAGAARFTLTIAPGAYREFALSLTDSRGAGGLELVVEGEGPAPVVLDGVALQLAADRISVRNLVLQGNRRSTAALDVRVATEFVGDRLALIDNECLDPAAAEPLVRLAASGSRGAAARAVLRNAWLLRNRVTGRAPLLATPRTGRADLAELRLEGCVIVGNAAAHGLEPGFTRQVVLAGCLLAEDGLGGEWLRLVSPLPCVRFDGGAAAFAGALVRYETGPDVARTDFPVVAVHGTALHRATLPDPADLDCRAALLAPPLSRPPDPAVLESLARQGQTPDPAQLLRLFQTR